MLRLFKQQPEAHPVRPSDVTGGFGKLELHTEFIRHQVNSREAVALDRWVSEGVNFMMRKDGAQWGGRLACSAGYRFVWTGSDSDRTVTGVLVPSRDKSGRPYPFVIYSITASSIFQDVPSAVMGIYESFYARAEAILAEPWSGQSIGVLTRMLDVLVPPDTTVSKEAVVDQEMTTLASTSMARLWHACGRELTPADRGQFLATLKSILQTVCRRAPGRIPWGIRLPLPADGKTMPVILFWIHLIRTLVGDASMRPHYIWTRSGANKSPRMTFFFRPVPPSYLLSLLDESVRDGAVYDILTEMRQPPVSPVPFSFAVSDDRLSLMAFLEAVGSGRRTT